MALGQKSITMPSDTGIWAKEEVEGQHVFSYRLAKYIGEMLPKNEPLYDFGCGLGTYSRYFRDIGFTNVVAVEGEGLGELFETEVVVHDLSERLELGSNTPGNLVCLEVAEHVPAEYMPALLENISRHCNGYLILSWAIPGQSGFGHVNCKSNLWVINRLEMLGFSLLAFESEEARSVVENHASWFKNTVLIFKKA